MFSREFPGSGVAVVLLTSILVLASGCAGQGGWMGGFAGDVVDELPLLRGYSVAREQRYPVAETAPIFVAGEDAELVEKLAGELRVYFLAVHKASETNAGHAGFVIRLAKQRLSVDEPDTADTSLAITVADARSAHVFDQLNIELSAAGGEQSDRKRLHAALQRAAAMLAGKS